MNVLRWLLALSTSGLFRAAFALLIWIILLLWIPQLSLLLVSLYLLLAIGLIGMRFYVASQRCCDIQSVPVSKRPFVSILVPICNEPPTLVIDTLQSILAITYPNFEVIVLDNNTTDPVIWQPVEAFCNSHPQHRFFHFDQLDGFKAGALNVSLEHCDGRSKFVLVLDADYQVKSNIIDIALQYCSDEKIGLVQFPQAYRHVADDNMPMACEYEHFFNIYMRYANSSDCVFSTGTVSFIRMAALKAIGGWGLDSLTEDVELGLKLYSAGYRGIYVNRRVGHGLMPGDFVSLRKQRLRWVYGNMQVLAQMFKLPRHTFTPKQWFSAIATLTARFNPLILPAVGAVTSGVAYALQPRPILLIMLLVCLVICWLTAVGRALFFWQVGRNRRWGFRDTAVAQYNPNAHLYLANPGYIDLDEPLQSDQITVLGALPQAEALRHVEEAFCVFYPQSSFAETFGLVFAEANQVGTSVLTHDIGSAREVLGGDAQLVDANASENVVGKLMDWWENGRPQVYGRPEFSLPAVLTQWEQLLGSWSAQLAPINSFEMETAVWS